MPQTPWTVACKASLSMGFPRQEYWSWLPFPPPGDLPNSGIKPTHVSYVSCIFRWILYTSATRKAQSQTLSLLCQLSLFTVLSPLLSFQQSSQHLHQGQIPAQNHSLCSSIRSNSSSITFNHEIAAVK